jgi:chaperonin GroES
MKLRSLHDRVVIRRIEGEEKTKGGMIIPACWPSKKGARQS